MFLKFSKDLNKFRMLSYIILYFLIAGSLEFEVFPKKIFTFTVLINMILCNEFWLFLILLIRLTRLMIIQKYRRPPSHYNKIVKVLALMEFF